MEHEQQIAERLEHAATLLERALARLEERQSALTGEVERISATIDLSRREDELAEKLAAAEREIAELKAAAATQPSSTASGAVNPLRKTLPASTTDMLAKRGIGDGPVDVRTLDAALTGLTLEQRIAVKSQLLRAGALS
jgi:F0F1-type ATP synthase membrane subunit b/b'